jgi:hypothetical protein
MKQLFIFSFIILCKISFAQNVGINIATPQAALDVYGDVIYRSADLVVANGVTTALNVNSNKFSYYRVNGPTANFTLAGITQGVEGRLVTLFNRSGFTMQLNNLDATASVNDRIITGTNGDLAIDDKGIVNLQYDGLEQKWIVVSNNKPGGGAISGGWGLAGNSGNTTANFIGNTDDVPLQLRTNNTTIAKYDAAKNNVFLGVNSGLNANPAATGIISIGQAAGYGANGTGNIYMGYAAGYFHRNGNDNILIGNNNDVNGNVTDNISNSVSIGTNVHVFESNRVKIGNAIQNTGIGLLVNQTPDHTLVVGKRRQSGPDVNAGALAILGSSYTSHFNYGNTEDTYIRGGKLLGRVYVNDSNGGDVILGSPTTSQVGIGTATPDVNARATIQTAMDYTTALVIRNPSNSIEFKTYLGGPANGNAVSMGTTGNNPIALYTNSANRILIDGVGNIGIGTNNPLGFAKLEVKTTPESRGLAVGDGNIGMVHFLGGAGRTTNSEGGYLGTNSNHPLHFFTNSSWAQLTLLPNGNVGIGTTNPTYKLSVNGNVRSKEVVVESGWADFVFDKKYNLLPLLEVEKYINKNKHLPNIPSAEEIQTNGLKVGELQTKMMQKIEELTLYVIELKKEIELLKEKNN